jgi:ribosomal protein S12 methylthiotransferase accessory factor
VSARRVQLGVSDGRRWDPEETFRRFRSLMEPAGITRIADVTGLDVLGVPVCLGVRPEARSLVISVGKGLDLPSARAGALMEALECWYAEFVEPDVRQTPAVDLDGPAVDPATLPGALGAFEAPAPAAEPRDWLRGTEAGTERPVWVPFEVVSLDYRCARLTDPWLARNSNGLASGTTRDEAVLHGLCEVIERDAEASWRTGDDSRRVDLATVTDERCLTLIALIRQAGLEPAVWDVTSDVEVPCFGCVIMPGPGAFGAEGGGVHDGFSCHPSAEFALAGALLEAIQKRLTYISGSRDDVTRSELLRATSPQLAEQVWHECLAEQPNVPFPVSGPVPIGATAELVDRTLDALAKAGLAKPVVVDLQPDEDGPAVVKTIVPGMDGPHGSCVPPLAGRRPAGL